MSKVKKGANIAAAKNPSLIGREAVKVASIFPDLLYVTYEEWTDANVKQYIRVLAVVDALVAVWNRVVKRVPAPYHPCDRATKANELKKLGKAYGDAFTIAFGANAHTHYTHYIARHIHEQVRLVHEIMDYSGQAGEHFGKKQKQRAQLTCKGGGKGKGEVTSYIKQLGKWDVIRE